MCGVCVCVCVCMKCSKVNLMSRWAPQFLPSVLMSCYYCLLLWAQTDWDVTADIRYHTHLDTHTHTHTRTRTQARRQRGRHTRSGRHTTRHTQRQECARGMTLWVCVCVCARVGERVVCFWEAAVHSQHTHIFFALHIEQHTVLNKRRKCIFRTHVWR